MTTLTSNLAEPPKFAAADPAARSGLVFKILITLTALIIVGLSLGLLIDRLYQPADFQIKEIALTGNPQHLDTTQVRTAIVEALAGNYFSIDTAAIRKSLARFAWLDEVRIRRRWPDTLMVDIVEHKPVARWQQDQWLTTKGKLVALPDTAGLWLPQLSGLADQLDLIYGQFQAWAPAFSKQGLRLTQLNLSPQHLWTLSVEVMGQFKTEPFEMVLLESNSSAQLATFLASIRQSLIDHPGGIERVDMRYSNGFSIKWNSQNQMTQ